MNYFAVPGIIDYSINIEDKIIKNVCEYYRVTKEDLVRLDGHKPLPIARHIAFYLMDKHTKSTLMDIAMILDRDHSTVIYAKKKISQQIKLYEDVREAVLHIENSLHII